MKKRKISPPAVSLLVGLLLTSSMALPMPGCKSTPPEETRAQKPAMSLPEYWQSLFEGDPENKAAFDRMKAEFRTGKHSLALTEMKELLKRSPEAPWTEAVEFYMAQAWTVLRQYQNALRAFDSFLGRYPNSPAAPRIMMSKGQIYLAKARQLGVSDTENALRQGYVEKAQELFQEIVKAYPEDPLVQAEAGYSLGEVYSVRKDSERAKKAFREVADTYGESTFAGKALYALAGVLLGEADVEGAGRAFSEIAERYPKSRLAAKAAKKLEGIRLVGSEAPPLQVAEWIGKPPAGGDGHEGKVTLLSFWAIWCPHCKRNIPKMERLLQTYRNKGVSVVGITREREGQGADKVKEFVERHPMSYPTGMDEEGKTSEAMGVKNIPCVVAVDPKGRIRWHGHPDYLTEKVIEGLLESPS
jgi:TolA-binding protein/peroxiredoxin